MTRKLDKDHLDAIQDLRERFAKNANWIGNVSIERTLITRQVEQIENQYAELMNQFDQLRKEESELLDTLKERYGEGQIDIQAGTFTSAE
jgi:predicted nuclease with TOPRIM domain